MVSPINKGNDSSMMHGDASMNEQMNFMLQQDQDPNAQNKENLNDVSGNNFTEEATRLFPQQDAVYKSQEGLVRESFNPNGIQETAGFAPQNPMTASYDNNKPNPLTEANH